MTMGHTERREKRERAGRRSEHRAEQHQRAEVLDDVEQDMLMDQASEFVEEALAFVAWYGTRRLP
jgi:hypothetical protein